jgi:mucolipin 2
MTLFSLANGDAVHDAFEETWENGLFGWIFLVIFMLVFFTAVQNIFIAIMMEGYD